MDIDQLQTFSAVAKLKNYSLAARELNLTQPGVTSRISKLEQELDCKLFPREKNAIALTMEGELFLTFTQNMIQQLTETREMLDQMKKPKIKIGISPALAPALISNTISKVKFKDINIQLVNGVTSPELLRMIMDGLLNIAVMGRPITNKHIYLKEIANDPMLFLVSPDHPLAKYDEITSELLNGESFICSNKSHLSSIDTGVFENINLNYIECSHWEIQKQLVRLGRGFGILPLHSLQKEDFDHFAIIPLKELQAFKKGIYVSCKKEYISDPLFIQFCEEMAKYCQSHINSLRKDKKIDRIISQYL